MRFLVILLLHLTVVLSAAPVFDWAASGGGIKADKVRGLNVDQDGNVFVAGECADEVGFGAVTHKGLGLNDVFVAKLDPRGKYLWSKVSGGPQIDRAYAVATDAQGNSYVTGHFQGASAEFDGHAVRGRGDYDAFVVSYDQDGRFRWIRTAGGRGYDYGHAVAVDSRGDVIVAGAVVGEATFGDVVVPNEPGAHIFVAKYHADGELVWVKVATGKAGGSAYGVVVDGGDNIYIGGLSTGVGAFGALPLSSPKGTSALVAKLDRDGQVLWLKQHLGEPSCLFHEITCDAQGRVWASGMIKGRAQVGTEAYATTGDKDSDALLCQYDADGKLLWSRVGQGPGIDYGLGVATDGTGDVFHRRVLGGLHARRQEPAKPRLDRRLCRQVRRGRGAALAQAVRRRRFGQCLCRRDGRPRRPAPRRCFLGHAASGSSRPQEQRERRRLRGPTRSPGFACRSAPSAGQPAAAA